MSQLQNTSVNNNNDTIIPNVSCLLTYGWVGEDIAGEDVMAVFSCIHPIVLFFQNHFAFEVCWWMRVFKAISDIDLSLDQGVEIFCDYQQTVGLLTKVDSELKTILRQEVQQGNIIHISWKPTSEMRHDKSPRAVADLPICRFCRYDIGADAISASI
ncbi:hypothetical protein V8E54_001996 [Elaphomyces granulatus]